MPCLARASADAVHTRRQAGMQMLTLSIIFAVLLYAHDCVVRLVVTGAGQKLALLGIAQPGWFVAKVSPSLCPHPPLSP